MGHIYSFKSVPTSYIHWGIWNNLIKLVFLLPSNISQSSDYCVEINMVPQEKALRTLESFSSLFLLLDGFGYSEVVMSRKWGPEKAQHKKKKTWLPAVSHGLWHVSPKNTHFTD